MAAYALEKGYDTIVPPGGEGARENAFSSALRETEGERARENAF